MSLFASTPLCLHRADIPRPGRTRDIMEFQFGPSWDPLPDDWHTRPSVEPV